MSHLNFCNALWFHYARYLAEYHLGFALIEVLQDGI